jgi:hypothetical protein
MTTSRRLFRTAFAAVAVLLSACGGGNPGGPEPAAALTLEKFAGEGASAVAGGAVAPTVRALRGAAPAAGVRVRFSVRTGGGALIDTLVTTGIDGTAGTVWLLGAEGGAQALSARVEGAAVDFSATATAPVPGTAYFGRNDYVEYVPGELPIIISAPHGGALQPAEIADRTRGTTVQDMNTTDLARRIAAALEELTGKRPHLVLMHLHRRKLDANREIEEAAQGNAFAERAWHEYHSWIETAKQRVEREYPRGFYADIHGHGHAEQRLELGYLLSAAELARSDAELAAPVYAAKSSVAALAEHSPHAFTSVLRGEHSFGALLEQRGYAAVPSPSAPHPEGAPYFSGGYSTARHGSRDGGIIDALQLEANLQGVRDTAASREVFALAFAESLLDYLALHADLALPRLQPAGE